MPIHNPTTFDQFSQLINTNKICLIDFYAQWCEPCKKLDKALEQFSSLSTPINIVKINVENDEFAILIKLCKITSMPFVIVFIDGIIQKEKFIGLQIDKLMFHINNKLLCGATKL